MENLKSLNISKYIKNSSLIVKFVNLIVNEENNLQYLLLLSDDLHLIKFNLEYNDFSYNIIQKKINLSEDIYFSNSDKFPLAILCCSVVLNRFYFILNSGKGFIFDFEDNSLVEIIINDDFPKLVYSSYAIKDSKFIIFGGITQNNKLNIKVFSYDFAFYTLSEEKVKENNFDGRFKHTSVAYGENIFIIGGFNSIKNQSQAKEILSIRYDTMMYKFQSVEFKGPAPVDIIDPESVVIENKILFFSGYKYNKIFTLDIVTKVSNFFSIDSFISSPISFINKLDNSLVVGNIDKELNLSTSKYNVINYLK